LQIKKTNDCIGEEVEKAVGAMANGEVGPPGAALHDEAPPRGGAASCPASQPPGGAVAA
jgi:hypothetical protein